jgi:DNA polymerase V
MMVTREDTFESFTMLAKLTVLHPLLAETQAPLISLFTHKVKAGFPSPADDHMEQGIDLNAYLVQRPAATFMMSVSGCSMQDAGIHDGDMVLVDRSLTPRDQDIVVAIVNQEMTLKRFIKNANGSFTLKAENPEFEDILVKQGDELECFGVVVSVIRKTR